MPKKAPKALDKSIFEYHDKDTPERKKRADKANELIGGRQAANVKYFEDMLATKKYWLIEIMHLATGEKVSFRSYITNHMDSFKSEWNAQPVFGRMDPIQTFRNTSRSISLGWEVPSVNEYDAAINLNKFNKFAKMFYPVYGDVKYQTFVEPTGQKNRAVDNAIKLRKKGMASGNKGAKQKTTRKFIQDISKLSTSTQSFGAQSTYMVASPILRLKYTNLIINPRGQVTADVDTAGVVGVADGINFEPDLEAGFFDPKAGVLLPKNYRLNFNFNVIHNHKLGYPESKIRSVFFYDNQSDRFPYAVEQNPDPSKKPTSFFVKKEQEASRKKMELMAKEIENKRQAAIAKKTAEEKKRKAQLKKKALAATAAKKAKKKKEEEDKRKKRDAASRRQRQRAAQKKRKEKKSAAAIAKKTAEEKKRKAQELKTKKEFQQRFANITNKANPKTGKQMSLQAQDDLSDAFANKSRKQKLAWLRKKETQYASFKKDAKKYKIEEQYKAKRGDVSKKIGKLQSRLIDLKKETKGKNTWSSKTRLQRSEIKQKEKEVKKLQEQRRQLYSQKVEETNKLKYKRQQELKKKKAAHLAKMEAQYSRKNPKIATANKRAADKRRRAEEKLRAAARAAEQERLRLIEKNKRKRAIAHRGPKG